MATVDEVFGSAIEESVDTPSVDSVFERAGGSVAVELAPQPQADTPSVDDVFSKAGGEPAGDLDPRRIRNLIKRPERLKSAGRNAAQLSNEISKLRALGVQEDEIKKVAGESLDPESSGSFGTRLFDFLEKLRAPQFAILNAFKAVQQGKTTSEALAAFGRGAATVLSDDMRKALGVRKEGTEFKELLEGAGVGELGSLDIPVLGKVTGRGTLGLLGDIVFDPLNLVGVGVLTKAGRVGRTVSKLGEAGVAVQKGSKLASKAEKLGGLASVAAKEGERALLSVAGKTVIKGDPVIGLARMTKNKIGETELIKSVGKLFSTKTGNKAFDDFAFKYRKLLDSRVGKAKRGASELGVRARRAGVTPEELNKVGDIIDNQISEVIGDVSVRSGVSERIAAIDKIQGISPGLKDVTKQLVNDFDIMANQERALGVLRSELEFYFPRIASKEFHKRVKDTGKGLNLSSGGRFSDNLQNAIGRKTETYQDFENALMSIVEKSGGGKVGGAALAESFVVKDPVMALAIRGVGSAKARTGAEFLDESVKRFGLKSGVDEIPDGFRTANVANDRLKDIHFDPEVADYLEGYWKIANKENEIAKFGQHYDKLTNWWKGWTLGVWPAYHSRNAVGNVWNNWLAGVKDPKRYTDARKIQKGIAGEFTTDAGQKYTFDEARKLGDEWGVAGTGIYGAELEESIQQAISGKLEPGFGIGQATRALGGEGKLPARLGEATFLGERLAESPAKNAVLSMGMMVGRGIENNARMAHFVDRLIKGDTPSDAAQSVMKFLFDYADLTEGEKFIRQKAIPFYTWTRKNLPLQLENLVKQPTKFSFLDKVKGGIEGDDTPNTADLREFVRENAPIRIRDRGDGLHEYFLLGNWLPAADIEKLFGPPANSNLTGVRILDEALQMLNPIPKGILEQATNRDIFRGREIERFPGESTRFNLPGGGKIRVRNRFMKPLSSLRQISEIQRIAGQTDLSSGEIATRFLTGARVFPQDIVENKLNRLREATQNVRSLRGQRQSEAELDLIRSLRKRGRP